MTEQWYELVEAERPLAQGDFILACPILAWRENAAQGAPDNHPPLQERAILLREDVVVMTQACDLEHHKVRNVVPCPHRPLPAFRRDWERWMTERKQTPSEKAWRGFCEDIAAGYVWNLTLLDLLELPGLKPDVRVVNFYDVFTVPRDFLEGLLREYRHPRPRLRAPYREHLSQAFARFFMRVGLPQPITPTW